MEATFKMLTNFESTAHPGVFQIIFGEMGTHLWNKFTNKSNSSVINFSRTLDTENHQRLMNYFQFLQTI